MRSGDFAKLTRFIATGLASNVPALALFWLIDRFFHAPLLAATACYALALILGFTLNRQWTFQHRGTIIRSFPAYTALYAAGFGIVLALHSTFDGKLISPLVVQLGAMLIVTALNYLALSFLIFREDR